MFSSKIVRSIAAVGTGSVAAMAAVAALAAAPSANAYPANNPPACEAQWLTTYCDGPIQPDGTFKRCASTLVSIASYVQPQTTCWMVDTSQPLLTNQPQHHINP
jgi:curli biogenesis system outer membrane secretion channel CsgG